MKKPNRDKEVESELLTALRFIACAQMDEGTQYQTHCAFREEDVIAFNGIIAAGYPIREHIGMCPHTKRLIAALSKVRGQFSVTELDTMQLAVRSDKFRALVPCVPSREVEKIAGGDTPLYPMTDDFKTAGKLAATFTSDNAQTVMESAVVTRAWSLAGTNRIGFIEALVSCNMPSGLVLPNAFCEAVAKVELKITHFAFSDISFTIYFENGAWIRTQLYQEAYPSIERAFDMMDKALPLPIPDDLWKAIDAVQSHSDDNLVVFDNNRVMSHGDDRTGAQYVCEGLPFVRGFDPRLLKKIKDIATKMDFIGNEQAMVFYGDRVRGAIACKARR